LGAERFEKEIRAQMAAAERSAAQQRLAALLGPAVHEYLERLANTDPLSRQVRELFALVRKYGPEAVAAAIAKAQRHAPSALIMSPTSCANSNSGERYSLRSNSATRH
jgi:hypothetical protein